MKAQFIHLDSFSNINQSIFDALVNAWPELLPMAINAQNTVRLNRRRTPYTLGKVFLRKGWAGINSFDSYKQSLLGEPFFFKRISSIVQEKIKKENPIFTLQTQSLFDFRVIGIPHFIYTDSTHLADQYWNPKAKQNNKEWIALETQLYHNATKIFVMSSHIQQSLIEQYGIAEQKIAMVGAGSNLNEPSNPKREDSYDSKKILFVGVEWERKGGSELWAAFQNILKYHPDAELIILGCSPPIHHPQVTIVGKADKASVGKYYQEAAVFCMPSRLEPFGIVYLEAMQHGLAIVGSDEGACIDLILDDESGYRIPLGDIKYLTEKLNYLLSLPKLCAKMGQRGRIMYENFYTWDFTAKKMKDIIQKYL